MSEITHDFLISKRFELSHTRYGSDYEYSYKGAHSLDERIFVLLTQTRSACFGIHQGDFGDFIQISRCFDTQEDFIQYLELAF